MLRKLVGTAYSTPSSCSYVDTLLFQYTLNTVNVVAILTGYHSIVCAYQLAKHCSGLYRSAFSSFLSREPS